MMSSSLILFSLFAASCSASAVRSRRVMDSADVQRNALVSQEITVLGECNHKNANRAHTAVGQLSLLPNADVIESLCASAKNATASFHDITNDYQLTKNYFDGGSAWNDGSDVGLAVDAARAVRYIDIAASSVRLDLPRGPQGDASEVISNFDNCQKGAAMCCFLNGGVSNTEVCAVDLNSSPRSNHVSNGWSVYNGNADDKTYCEGFTWDADDETSFSSRHRGNTLFEISVRKNLLEQGRVKNVPGAPMCGCIDQMPIVTEASCTEPTEAYVFKYGSDGEPSVYLDIKYEECGPLSKKEGLSDHVVGKDNCAASVDKFLLSQQGGPYRLGNPWWYADENDWTPIVGKGTQYWYGMSSAALRDATGNANGLVVWRVCTSCAKSHRNIYYVRRTPVPKEMDLWEVLLNSWAEENNVMGGDFMLYSTLEDALAGTDVNAWKFCNYRTGYGFPYECGPIERTKSMWNSFKKGGGYAKDVAFYLLKEYDVEKE